jgi:hypothetical protein
VERIQATAPDSLQWSALDCRTVAFVARAKVDHASIANSWVVVTKITLAGLCNLTSLIR